MNSAERAPASARDASENGSVESEALRRRKPTQATFADDTASPLPYIGRRGSSFRRNSSLRTDSVAGSRRSTDSLFMPRPTDEPEDHEPSLWHSTPLLFAILPAIGGVMFKQGSVLLTDLALLVLAALYLNWCLVTPWIWYHSAQSVKVADFPPEQTSLGGIDEALGDGEAPETSSSKSDETKTGDTRRPTTSDPSDANATLKELRMHELTALALCFIGPLLGSYILHVIRQQLSTIGDQLISNLHLTLFVLGAEIRPLRYAMKMAQARTIYLQRLVREDPHAESEADEVTVQDLSKRLNELEASYADKVASNDLHSSKHSSDNEELMKRVQSSLQTQIDALNRAVRRYEKRATAQTMQTEARLQDLDMRLKETISLAAAAASYSQKPGVVLLALSSLKSMALVPVSVAWAAVSYPFQLTRVMILRIALRLGLVTTGKTRAPTGQSRAAGENSAPRKVKKTAAAGKE